MMRPAKIISGGQTGSDLAGLRAALALQIPCGGWMPRGFRNELGERPWMAKMYGMREHASPLYQPRTKANVEEADVTLIFGETRSPGTKLTLSYLGGLRKPFLVNPTVQQIQDDIPMAVPDPASYVVNIAGNRESTNRGIEAYVYRLLIEAWAEGERLEALRKVAPWPDPLPKLTRADPA